MSTNHAQPGIRAGLAQKRASPSILRWASTSHFLNYELSAMKIDQKKLSNRHTFTFEPERLNFAYRDKSGSGDVDIPYAEFPLKSSTRIDQNLWLRNVGYLWCALGVIQMGIAITNERPLTGTGFWFLLGVGCLLWTHFTKVTYTVFSTDRGSVWVIQDANNHDRIINEVRLRRKNQLLAWYGDINLESDLDKEVGKFRWLEEQQALTSEEAERRIAQAHAVLGVTGVVPPVTIN